MELGEAARAQFEAQGWVHLRSVLEEAEVAALRAELAAVYAALPAEERERPNPRRLLPMLRRDTPTAAALPDDARWGGVAEALQGPSYLCGLNGYVLSGGTGWHPDFVHGGDFAGCEGLVIAVYLEPLTKQTGALRIVAESHREPLHTSLNSAFGPYSVAPSEWPCEVCETQPTDVLVWHSHVWHASMGGGEHRTAVMMSVDKRPGRNPHPSALALNA